MATMRLVCSYSRRWHNTIKAALHAFYATIQCSYSIVIPWSTAHSFWVQSSILTIALRYVNSRYHYYYNSFFYRVVVIIFALMAFFTHFHATTTYIRAIIIFTSYFLCPCWCFFFLPLFFIQFDITRLNMKAKLNIWQLFVWVAWKVFHPIASFAAGKPHILE